MEENSYQARHRFPKYKVSTMGARGRMLVCSIVILLLAIAAFFGIITVFCFIIAKLGLFGGEVF